MEKKKSQSPFDRLGVIADENIAIVDDIIRLIEKIEPKHKDPEEAMSPEGSDLVKIAQRVLGNNKRLIEEMKRLSKDT